MSNKKKQLEVNSIAQTSNSSQSNSYYMNIEQDSSSDELSSGSLHEDNLQDNENIVNIINQFNNNNNRLLYNLDEVEEIISRQFQDAENLNEPVNIAFEIELDSGLIESTLPESWLNIHNPKDIKKSFHQLINIVLLPLEHGSGYYWEVRKIYLNTRKKEFTGCVTAYLGCAQREDRKWQRPEDQPIKRRSEAHTPIEQYNCIGKIILTIDPQQQQVIVQGTHQQMHVHPQYRKIEFPEAAKLWIQDNIKYNLQNSELYRRLQHHNLINVQIHTKEQTYYWASQNFKITFYLENDFIRALGFTTSLLDCIGITKIKEIIVDSTFKTNQERFELFVVNTNCGGFGVPIAYLYLLTCDATVESYNNPQNQINTRNGKNFLPTFLETKRHHYYPIIYFGTDKVLTICKENDPWERFRSTISNNSIEVVNLSSSNLQNMELVERININNEIEEKLAYYKKIFDSALILYRREKDNPHFVKNFDTLLKPVVKAIEECESKLNARIQQRTWRSKNDLAFWLR
ncbi:ATP-dependent DNA helicase pif1 [Gigaspora margarita]|uniref:ATP-dependent DNA helicase pif1 n=1 Tax=Gigaspora margarita TaxID=4874 RepID=A0A8H4B1E5_GIGMA|nr:ATP-dependent DNA helicase pif1 [Gigaspora margarita]